jgi:peptidase E
MVGEQRVERFTVSLARPIEQVIAPTARHCQYRDLLCRSASTMEAFRSARVRPGQAQVHRACPSRHPYNAAMKRREFLRTSILASIGAAAANVGASAAWGPAGRSGSQAATRKILIAGGNYGTVFIRYMAELTGKTRPKLCFLPTASADADKSILNWYRNCAPLNVEPSDQLSFIESLTQKRSWEDVFLSVDGIVVSGGNTLNQQAIWKAQGIDLVLRQAWDRGVVLGGASAGSLCWFEEGTTDSRPKELTIVQGLGFIKGSHCPHYDAEAGRRPLYTKLIASGQMKPGYACDNEAGIYFEDNTVTRVVSAKQGAKVYYVSLVNGQVVEKPLEPELIR